MGIIIRQSVKSAVWSYLGIVIGYINVGIIMPQFFSTAEIGLVNLFASVSLIFAQFGTLGFTSVINRLFTLFRSQEEKHHGFLFLAVVTGMVGFSLCVVSFFLLKPWIVETNIGKSPLLVEYLWLLLPLVFMRILFQLLDNYNKMLYDAVTGVFWLEFMHKLINLALILLFIFGWIGFSIFFIGYVISMSIPVIPLILVLAKKGNFHLKSQLGFLKKPLMKEIRLTLLFGFINGLSGIMLVNVDKIFINQYLSLSEVGIFGVCALFATLIRVPYNSISKIATGIISDSWKRNDRQHIQEIYQKSALNQAILGTLIFIGILVNIENIFAILPGEYSSGKGVLVIYSAAMLISTTIGLAGNITETSRYYKFNTLFLMISILLQFLLSAILIPVMGMIGAAISSAATLVLNALLQAALQKKAFGIYGYSKNLLWILFFGGLSFIAGWILPGMELIPDILVRSSVVVAVFGLLVYFSRQSEEINLLIRSTARNISLYLKRSTTEKLP